MFQGRVIYTHMTKHSSPYKFKVKCAVYMCNQTLKLTKKLKIESEKSDCQRNTKEILKAETHIDDPYSPGMFFFFNCKNE